MYAYDWLVCVFTIFFSSCQKYKEEFKRSSVGVFAFLHFVTEKHALIAATMLVMRIFAIF